MTPEMIAAIGWKGVVLILGLVAILVLRSPLGRLIDRLRSVSGEKDGGWNVELSELERQQKIVLEDRSMRREGLALPKAESNPAPSVEAVGSAAIVEGASTVVGVGTAGAEIIGNAPTATVAMDADRAAAIRDFGMSPLIISSEVAIKRDLQTLPEADRINALVRHLAVAQMEAAAERIYRVIYGSQIAVLHHLNLSGPTPITKLIEDFYKPAVARFPEVYAVHSTTADSYFGFLEQSNLLERVGPDKDHYVITVVGRAFLQWLVARGISFNKGL